MLRDYPTSCLFVCGMEFRRLELEERGGSRHPYVRCLRGENDVGVREGPGGPWEQNPQASDERYMGSSGHSFRPNR